VKSPARAKSRLDATGNAGAYPELVAAMRADTIAAVRGTAGVARIVAVVDEPGVPVGDVDDVIVQTVPGLNPALQEAWAHCARRWPDAGIAAIVGDVPALRTQELADALREAADTPLGYVADAASTGTTLLTARPGAHLQPQFGAGSAARHARVATALVGGAGLRQDVDTPADLIAALRLGAGSHTEAVAAGLGMTAPEGDGLVPAAPRVTPRSPECDRMSP
jgi:2-phospho-L-lactate guanylyltransferase